MRPSSGQLRALGGGGGLVRWSFLRNLCSGDHGVPTVSEPSFFRGRVMLMWTSWGPRKGPVGGAAPQAPVFSRGPTTQRWLPEVRALQGLCALLPALPSPCPLPCL